MNYTSAVKAMLSSRGYSMRRFQIEVLGYKDYSGGQDTNGSPRLSRILRYATPLGYRLVLSPAGSHMPDGCLRLDEYREPLADAQNTQAIDFNDPNVMIG